MKFTDRKDFLYDSDVFKRYDSQTALKIHAEAVQKHSPNPHPTFFEVSRDASGIDPLWLYPKSNSRIQISREIPIPSIVRTTKPRFELHRTGRGREQVYRFWLANLHLQQADYFPWIGDYVFYGGYRMPVTNVEFEQDSFWLQTNLWLGLVVVASVSVDGDALPPADPSKLLPAEKTIKVAPEK